MNLAQEAQDRRSHQLTVRCARASPPRGPHARIAGRRASQRHPAREMHTASRGDDSSMPLTHTHIGEAHTDAATHPGGAWAGPPAFCPRAHACTLPRLRRRHGASRSQQSHARAVRRSLCHTTPAPSPTSSRLHHWLCAHIVSSYTTTCLLYTSPSPRDGLLSRMPSSA